MQKNYYQWADALLGAVNPYTRTPLGKDPAGFRIVKVHPDRIAHTYYSYENMPANVDMTAPQPTNLPQ